jgi:DNA-binding winged helix-turn-helix (wHTH) protein
MPTRTRFADFVFDPSSGELWRAGQPVHIESQPAIALAHLVSRPGSVVTREELARLIWGTDTHVQCDDGLNYCIRQVRQALEDNPRSPAFIETIPRRGYRFIAPVRAEAVPAFQRRAIPAIAAAMLLMVALIESRPNNHHEIAVAAARALHDLIF